jgi:peptidyl-Lys metalloendopeptidase
MHAYRLATAAASLLVASSVHAAVVDGIDVRLTTAAPVVQGDADVVVRVTITNTNTGPVTLHPWQLPGARQDGALFEITRDGVPVPYTGAIVKRAAPTGRDALRLNPGVTLTYDVELTAAYELERDGRYDITYRSGGVTGAYTTPALRSDTLYVWLQGRTPQPSASAMAMAQAAAVTAGSVSFTGNCSATRKTTLQNSVTAAKTYATNAVTYLNNTPSTARKRYVKWFGTPGAANWGVVKANYTALQAALETKPLVLDCSCTDAGVYAYVYPSQPYKVYLCGAFWGAPMTGTDSKAGTLIHEITHFTAVAGTSDYAYGQSAAASLAISSPAKAIKNADSHEYFAENTPVLP